MLTNTQPFKLAALFILFMLFPLLALLSVHFTPMGSTPEGISYMLMDKSRLQISIRTVNPGINTLAADSENGLVLKILVGNHNGAAVAGAGVRLESSISAGSFHPSEGMSGADGSFVSIYTPPSSIHDVSENIRIGGSVPAVSSTSVKIISRLSGTDKNSSLQIKLVPVPVVLIHGYQASPNIFSGISEYLKGQGFKPLSFSYTSENGVAPSASELSNYLKQKTVELEAGGIQVSRFDLVTHSMGGLVARYYTCSSEYPSRSDVRKLIFLSVPQKGSPFASLGLQYYADSGIRDLIPASRLYTAFFPAMINGGLNPSIQTGSLLGNFDEVVGAESASLAEWKIETEIFDLGESNFTVDKLLTGEILQAANHKLVLYNKKVYQRVQKMLDSQLPFPSIK